MSYDGMDCDYNQATQKPNQPNPNQPPHYQPQSNMQQYSLNPSTSVMVNPAAGMQFTAVAVNPKPAWSWAVTITSVLTFIFCCAGNLCAFVGIIQSIHAYVDHKVADYRRSTNKRHCAWGFTIAALVFGSIFWIAIIILAANGKFVAERYNNFDG